MIKSHIITACIDELANLKLMLMHIEGSSPTSNGYNCAIDCVRDSLQTRIDSLHDSLREYSPQDCIDEKNECYNEIASMLDVLNADCANLSDSEFDTAYVSKMRECIAQLIELQKKYS